MPVPTQITDLSTTAALNSPAGTETAKGTIDNYMRSHASFIAQNRDKLLERASVIDYMTAAQRLDVLSGSPTLDVTGAFNAAIAAARNVYVPEGTYLISNVLINRNYVTICGAGMYASRLIATEGAQPSINIASSVSVSFVTIKSLTLQGNATALGGIKVGTATNYVAGLLVEDVLIDGYTNAAASMGYGIQLWSNQNTEFKNVWTQNSRINLHRVNSGYCTSTRWHGKRSYLGISTHRSVLFEGQADDLYIEDGVIEGNLKTAIEISNTAISGGRGTRVWLKKLYFEDNLHGGVDTAVILVVGGASAYQEHRVSMDSCTFAADPSAPGGYKKLSVDHVIGRVHDTLITPQDILTTATCFMRFEFNRNSSAADALAGYRALLGSVSVSDFTPAALGTDAEQVNYVNSIQFPATQRAINDPNTLDDYREGTWTPVLSSDATPPTYTNVDPATGTYTKIGNLMFARCVVRANISAIGTGTPRVTGLPYNGKGLEPPVVGLSTALSSVAGSKYLISGPAVIFNSAAYVVSSDCYLVFTIVYQVA